MKIGEILELTKEQSLAKIAKERLSIGEKKARIALKNIGAYPISGKKGWFYDGDEAVLEKSIYDYVTVSNTGKPKATKKVTNASIDDSTNESPNNSEKLATNKPKASKSKETNQNATDKGEIDFIDILLQQNVDTNKRRVYRGFYWDQDIIEFLDNVKHGNKSDLLNEIVRTVLKAKGLLK